MKTKVNTKKKVYTKPKSKALKQGAVYGDVVTKMEDARQLTRVPYDPSLPVLQVKNNKTLPFTTGGPKGPVEYMPTDVHPSFIF